MREDWIECSLVEACQVLDNLRKPINSNERNQRIKGKSISELYPYYGATGQVGFIDDYLTDGEYILLGEDAAPFLDYTKDVAYKITGKTWVNNHAHILKSYFNDDFLLHFLNQFQYKDYVTGTTRLKLTQGALKRMTFKLAPLPIQRAIVSKIEALFSDLDNGIANFKTAQEQLKVYRQAVLKKAFEGGFSITNEELRITESDGNDELRITESITNDKLRITKEENQSNQSNQKNHSSDNKEDNLPNGWKWVKISEIAIINPALPNKSEIDKNIEVQFLPMKLVEEIVNKIHLTETRVFVDVSKGSYTPFIDGDIIFAKVTPCMENGKVAIVNKLRNGIGFGSSEFHVLRCSDKINNSYLFNFIVQENFRNRAQAAMTGAVGLRRVPKQFIENFLIPLPPTIEEQTQIVQEIESRLSVTDNLEFVIRNSIEKAEALRQSILKKAFEGKLLSEAEIEQCKQAADYEPASELLKKIQAEKAERITNGKLRITKKRGNK